MLKKYLSIFLIFLFISPSVIRGLHHLFVHHEHQHILLSSKNEIKEKHNSCPICTFNFIEFFTKDDFKKISKEESLSTYYLRATSNISIANLLYSFHLRAPPSI